MKKPDNIFLAFTILLTAIFAVTLITFAFGLSRKSAYPTIGPKTLGLSIGAEAGKETLRIFQINEHFSYFVDENYIAIMGVEKAGYPLAFACGSYQASLGPKIAFPKKQGDYVYGKNYVYVEDINETSSAESWTIFHIPTGEVSTVPTLAAFTQASLNPNGEDVAPEWVFEQAYKELPALKESCVSITLAEMILLIPSLIGTGIVAIMHRKKTQKT